MKRAGLLLGGFVLAVLFGGTIVYAAVKIESPTDGVVHACYDKGGKGAGKVRIVNDSATDCKTKTENPLTWRALNTFEQFEGMPCVLDDEAGTIALTYDANGVATFQCGPLPVSCTTAGDCPPPADDECAIASCGSGVCGIDFEPGGTSCTGGTCDGSGTCVPGCGPGLSLCGVCVDLSEDANHCGECNIECDAVCDEGVCDP